MTVSVDKKPSNETKKKIIGEIIAIIIGVAISLIPPPEGLTAASMRTIGILVWAIINWITKSIPDYVAALLMCTLWAAFKVVPFTVAFGSFSGTTWWTLIGALGIGIAVNKSGLLKRASLMAMKLFPSSFNGQIMALIGAGTLVAPAIPSTTAKCAITAPVAISIGETLGLEKRSKGMVGLFSAMYVGFSLNATIFISASFLGYMTLGLLPDDVQTKFNWLYWFICMIPWAIVTLVGSYIFITHAYKPDKANKIPHDYINNQIKELGPMSRDEKITLTILLICLVFWIGESFIGIPAVITALAGMFVLMGLNVFGKAEFHSKMVWSLMFFIGSVLNLGSVLPAVGINEWIGNSIAPFLTQFVENPYLLIIAITLVIYAMRAIIASLAGAITLFTVMLVPIAVEAGINPWVIGITSYVSVMVWYLQYQNANFLSAFAAAGGEENVPFKSTVKMSLAYMVLSLLGLLISVPYWKILGLIK